MLMGKKQTSHAEIDPLENIYTVEDLAKKHPNLFTARQLAWLIKSRHKNGLNEIGAVIKVSRRLYIKKPLFIKWFMQQEAS